MKVKELIKALEQEDPDIDVIISVEGSTYDIEFYDIDFITQGIEMFPTILNTSWASIHEV